MDDSVTHGAELDEPMLQVCNKFGLKTPFFVVPGLGPNWLFLWRPNQDLGIPLCRIFHSSKISRSLSALFQLLLEPVNASKAVFRNTNLSGK